MLSVRIAIKLLRSAAVRRTAFPVLVAAVVVVVLFCGLQSMAVTGPQAASRDLGRFDARVAVESPASTGVESVTSISAAIERAGGQEPTFLLQSFEIEPSDNSTLFVSYFEAPWGANPFPGRFRLTSGRWPSAPGEVVVSDPVAASVLGGRLSVLAGNADLLVVGRILDDSARVSARILAAPRTWSKIVDDRVRERMGSLLPSTSVLWVSSDPEVQRAAIISAQAMLSANGTGVDPATAAAAESLISNSWIDRRTVLTRERSGPLQRYPLGYLVPSFFLPALATAVGFSVNSRRIRRHSATLRAIGMSVRSAGRAAMLATALSCFAMALGGAVLGAVLGWLARPGFQALRNSPLAPYELPWLAAAQIILVTIATTVTLSVLEISQQRRESVASVFTRRPPGPVLAAASGVISAVAVVALWWLILTIRTVDQALLIVPVLVVITAIAAPRLLRLVLAGLPHRGPIPKLSARRLAREGGKSAWAVSLIAMTIGSAVAMLSLLETIQATEARDLVSSVPRNQVVLSANQTAESPPSALVAAVREQGGAELVEIAVWDVFDDARSATVTSAGLGSISALDNEVSAQHLCAGRLRPTDLAVLKAGGFVMLGRRSEESSLMTVNGVLKAPLYVTDIETTKVQATQPVPVSAGDCGPEWNSTTGAILLRSSASSLQLPIGSRNIVFTGTSEQAAVEAAAAGRRLGYGPGFLSTYEPLIPASTPPGLIVTILGLCVASVLTVFSLARAQAGALRRYAAGLIALGVPVSWAGAVLRREITLIVALGAALGLPIAVTPLLVIWIRLPGVILEMPWVSVVGLILGCVLALAVGVAVATRRISARERTIAY